MRVVMPGTSGGTGRSSASGDNGSDGLNGGAKGGNCGGNYISNRPHAGGGAGGSRLPALNCPYVSEPYTATFSGGSGGYAGDTHGSAGADASAYPEFIVGQRWSFMEAEAGAAEDHITTTRPETGVPDRKALQVWSL